MTDWRRTRGELAEAAVARAAELGVEDRPRFAGADPDGVECFEAVCRAMSRLNRELDTDFDVRGGEVHRACRAAYLAAYLAALTGG